MAFQDPAQKLYTPLDEVVPCTYVLHKAQPGGPLRCPANAFKYDENPQKPGEVLCREHRTWSWVGAWETQLWSLRIWPAPSEAWWQWFGQHMNKWAYDERLERYDLGKTIQEIRRHGNQKLDIVLPTADWLLGWAKREEQRREERRVRESARRALEKKGGLEGYLESFVKEPPRFA